MPDDRVPDDVRPAEAAEGPGAEPAREPAAGAPSERLIVLFDGVCNLCSQSVQFIIERDPEARFRFCALQSDPGIALLNEFDLPTDQLASVVFIEGDRVHTHSTAALRIARRLGWGWRVVSWLRVVPRFLRDPVYGWIARNRYRWFGQKESCWLPTPDLRARFIA